MTLMTVRYLNPGSSLRQKKAATPQHLDGPSSHIMWSLVTLTDLNQNFSTSALLAFWPREFFVVGDCPVQCGMLSRMYGLYSLDASSSHPVQSWQPKNVYKIAKYSPGSKVTLYWDRLVEIIKNNIKWVTSSWLCF